MNVNINTIFTHLKAEKSIMKELKLQNNTKEIAII